MKNADVSQNQGVCYVILEVGGGPFDYLIREQPQKRPILNTEGLNAESKLQCFPES